MDEDFNQLRLLTEVVKDAISHKENGNSKKLIYFIRRSLGQVGLSHEYEESEILIQAYLRARDKILSGEYISNHSAYLSRVAYFIILEESKRRNRRGQLSQKLSYAESGADIILEKGYAEGVSDELVNSLWTSFDSLSERDQRILILRIVKGLSWREIGTLMVRVGQEKNGGKNLESKLRKQGERALAKLRKQLMSVNDKQLK
jgi:DNA-directed RNA polymerase specialized sigma24 family protein